MFSVALKSKAVRWIGAGWTAFIAENLIMSHNREYIIKNFSDDTYHNVYNCLSTAACGSIAWGYFKYGRRNGPMLSSPRGKAMIIAGSLIQTLGLVGLSQIPPKLQIPVTLKDAPATSKGTSSISKPVASEKSFQVRCPMDFKASDVPPGTIYGLERVSRHATFWSLGICCAGYAMTTAFIAEIVMFSFPLVFALIGSEHQDYRFRRGSGGTLSPEKDRKTSNIPFGAVVRGEQSLADIGAELKWMNVALAAGAGLAFALRRLR